MLARSPFVRSVHAFQSNADRYLVAHHHQKLVESRYWNCSSPSQALAVLGVLVRSGTIVDKLDWAASGALNAMAPSMTKNERALLGRLSPLLRLKGVTDSTSSVSREVELEIPKTDVNSDVFVLYSQFIKHRQGKASRSVIASVLSSDLVLQLDAVTSLMLLEMTLSVTFQADSNWREEGIVSALLTRLRHHVMCSDVIGFKAVWWILIVLGDTQSVVYGRPIESGRLFRACLQRMHDMLPKLSIWECLLVFPLLDASPYGRPFIICGDIVKRLVACDVEELMVVPTSVVLHALECDGLPLCVRRKLCQMLGKDLRFGDLAKEECLFLLSTMALRLPVGEADADDECLFELLFAQIYVVAKSMSAVECVKALEYLEHISLSHTSVSVSCGLSERLKKRALLGVMQTVKLTSATTADLELNLESVYRLEGLLKRCVLLPYLDGDAAAISERIAKLTHQLNHLDRGVS
ncbi:hypothetical protein DQ04_06461010 [Trypanosoma grayi]|uniref:hypothetical protein n=1 Tax=Trypanosoma grayi TaxID=71804 RepID=UPI0004F4857D|nr:hypothetical protein DQ04_06461010 [Trypanosoma grayi]KEG08781.1 hypothetical protein DQ04_06461010 [Trypanosoma grayi]